MPIIGGSGRALIALILNRLSALQRHNRVSPRQSLDLALHDASPASIDTHTMLGARRRGELILRASFR